MKILITNNRLDYRGGAEAVVRDLAQAFQSRGHTVMAYSSSLQQRERLLENDGIPVATDLENLKFTPDIIHGQHHLDAMTALLALPGVPAVYHCHGAVQTETLPLHPRIFKYFAMSETLKQRMLTESNLPEDAVEVVLNGVHTGRFRHVRTAPEQPGRAVFYNGHHRPESPTLAVIRQACERADLSLDLAGRRLGKTLADPAEALPAYDLVFANGKSAIDALACGCAVIILGRNSCGPMAIPENFEALRQANFSIAANCPPTTTDAVLEEIQKYSPPAVAEVTRRTREECDMRGVVDRLLQIYAEVLEQARDQPWDFEAETKAAGLYLRRLVPLMKLVRDTHEDAGVPLATVESLRRTRVQLEELNSHLSRII
jgi:hypothetical protein